MGDYENEFKRKVQKALGEVKKILEVTRQPLYAAEVQHEYEDKYRLVEAVVSAGVAAQWGWLEEVGLGAEGMGKLMGWAGERRAVTLRFEGTEECTFEKMQERKEESKDERVTTTKVLGITATSSSKVVTTVKEWLWQFTAEYQLWAYPGTGADAGERVLVASGKSRVGLKTASESAPYPQRDRKGPWEVDTTWMLRQVDGASGRVAFRIARGDQACRTPRRNPQADEALGFVVRFGVWAEQVDRYLAQLGQKEQPVASTAAIDASTIFVPVLPLFEEKVQSLASSSSSSSSSSNSSSLVKFEGIDGHDESQVMLSVGDVNGLLAQQRETLRAKFAELGRVYTNGEALLNAGTARLRVALQHSRAIGEHVVGGVELVETMLRNQLVAAIGKVVSPVDFSNYMRFHNRKLFLEAYEPKPFCYAVRRPEHYPEGTLSIEGQLADGSIAQPILTSVRAVEPVHAMRFAIDASTSVTFRGERFLHSWINSSFGGAAGQSLSLVARARQFSSFIVLVGKVASATAFEPTGAMIIQNKDELTIPLMLETIPTPKEFRDAIESLSPEQQRFAKAYRAMQLESTLFGVCVIQIKPQLEKLLNLPSDALTKEIRLTQDLMDMFLTYQIPSDLLSYDGPEHASLDSKLATVKTYVARIQEMIQDKKNTELEESKQKAQAAVLSAVAETRSTIALNMDSMALCQSSSISPIGSGGGLAVGRGGPPSRGGPPGGPAPQFFARTSAPVPRPAPPAAVPRPYRCRPTVSSAPVSSQPSGQPASSVTPKPVKTKPEDRPADKKGQEDEQEGDDGQEVFDFTQLPHLLDRKFEQLDLDSALRPTIIKPGKNWTKKHQPSLLAKQQTKSLSKSDKKDEKNKAFDLLDALSRSGALPVEDASFHVVLAATHCFAKSVIDTVVQDNVNPIEKVERSLLIVATTVQGRAVSELLKPDQLSRVKEFSPNLFD